MVIPRNRIVFIAVLLSALALGGGCTFDSSSFSRLFNRDGESNLVDEFANAERESLKVSVGQAFTIKLEGNEGAAGYRWSEDHTRNNIEFIKDEYVPGGWTVTAPDGGDEVVKPDSAERGAHFFTFEATKRGNAQVKFEYSKPGGEEGAMQMIIYDLTVE